MRTKRRPRHNDVDTREGDEEFVDLFSDEHSWWAQRPGVSGPPVDKEREEARREDEHKRALREAEAKRRAYWSGERLLQMSEMSEGGHDVYDDPALDPYAVLGLQPGASLSEARHARKEIAKRMHPDIAADPDALRQMAAVNSALDEIERMLTA